MIYWDGSEGGSRAPPGARLEPGLRDRRLSCHPAPACDLLQLPTKLLFDLLGKAFCNGGPITGLRPSFSQRGEVGGILCFSTVEFSKVSILTGIVKISLKVTD